MKATRAGVLLLMVLAACASTVGSGGQAREGATLVVDNQSSSQMTIYALRGGSERIRLGDAWALRSTTLRIPATLVQGVGLRFLADPIGSQRTPISHEITVWPGDTVEMRIPPGQ